jgi:hypothetical protein
MKAKFRLCDVAHPKLIAHRPKATVILITYATAGRIIRRSRRQQEAILPLTGITARRSAALEIIGVAVFEAVMAAAAAVMMLVIIDAVSCRGGAALEIHGAVLLLE